MFKLVKDAVHKMSCAFKSVPLVWIIVGENACHAISSEQGLLQTVDYELECRNGDFSFSTEQLKLMQSLIQHCRSALKTERLKMEFLIDSSISRNFIAATFKNARSIDDVRASASFRFKELYGHSAEPLWTIDGEWSATRSFLVGALPTQLINQISTLARAQNIQTVTIFPLAIYLLSLACRSPRVNGWLMVRELRHSTLCVIDQQRIVALRTTLRTPSVGMATNDAHNSENALMIRETVMQEHALLGQLYAFGAEGPMTIGGAQFQPLYWPSSHRSLEGFLNSHLSATGLEKFS